jgi:hypothetical protein
VGVAIGVEHGSHQDAGPATPNTGLDEIAGDVILENDLSDLAQIGHAAVSDHAMRPRGPVAADFAQFFVVSVRRPAIVAWVLHRWC